MADKSDDKVTLKQLLEALNKNDVTAANISAGTGAGTIEANILASRAIKDIADDIAQSVAGSAGTNFIIWTAETAPSFASIEAFDYRCRHLDLMFKTADADFQKAKKRAPSGIGIGVLNVAGPAETLGTLLSASAKVASYFQVESAFASLTTTGVDGRLLATATAGSLRDLGCKALDPAFAPTKGAAETLREQLDDLLTQAREASDNSEECQSQITQIDEAIAKFTAKTAAKTKAKIKAEKELWLKAKASLDLALKTFEALLSSLAAEKEEDAVVSKLISELALRDLLGEDKRKILSLSVHAHGGASVTRKSIWSFLPTFRPFKVSAGVVASFAVVDASGEVLMSDSVDSHAGYHGVGGIRSSVSHRLARIERRKGGD